MMQLSARRAQNTGQRSEDYGSSPESMKEQMIHGANKQKDAGPARSPAAGEAQRLQRQIAAGAAPRGAPLKTAGCSQELRTFEGYSNWHQFDNASPELVKMIHGGAAAEASAIRTAGASTAMIKELSAQQNQFPVHQEPLQGESNEHSVGTQEAGETMKSITQINTPRAQKADSGLKTAAAGPKPAPQPEALSPPTKSKLHMVVKVVNHQPTEELSAVQQESTLAQRTLGAQQRQLRERFSPTSGLEQSSKKTGSRVMPSVTGTL